MTVTDKYSLSIKEAARYFGIGVKKMLRLAKITWEIFLFTVGIVI